MKSPKAYKLAADSFFLKHCWGQTHHICGPGSLMGLRCLPCVAVHSKTEHVWCRSEKGPPGLHCGLVCGWEGPGEQDGKTPRAQLSFLITLEYLQQLLSANLIPSHLIPDSPGASTQRRQELRGGADEEGGGSRRSTETMRMYPRLTRSHYCWECGQVNHRDFCTS